MCWQYLDLGPGITEVSDAVSGIRMLCDAYRLAERGDLVETILWWQDRCWRGVQGVITEVRSAWRWVRSHRDRLHAEVQ